MVLTCIAGPLPDPPDTRTSPWPLLSPCRCWSARRRRSGGLPARARRTLRGGPAPRVCTLWCSAPL